MNTFYILTILFWALTGVVGYLFFGDEIWGWLNGFNLKYGKILQPVITNRSRDDDPAPTAKILLGAEIFAFVIGYLLARHPVFGFWFSGVVLFGIYYTAQLVLQREFEEFDNQMVDITIAFRNALKSGMTLQQAMNMIASDFQPPASTQFAMVMREIQVGASIEEALQHMCERLDNADLRMVVDSIEILRKTGGNMVETFEGVSETIKTRKKIEGKIKTMVAMGRFQTIMLCLMPFIMAGLLYILNRPYISLLFTTLLGWVILSGVVGLVITGWVVINKLITIEV